MRQSQCSASCVCRCPPVASTTRIDGVALSGVVPAGVIALKGRADVTFEDNDLNGELLDMSLTSCALERSIFGWHENYR